MESNSGEEGRATAIQERVKKIGEVKWEERMKGKTQSYTEGSRSYSK